GLAREKGARYVLASTSEAYGDPAVHPQPESYWGHVNPVGPRGVYDEAKRFAEALTMAYRRTHDVDTGIVRIFNTYGPRMRPDDGRAIPTFIRQSLAGEPITVAGDGAQTRSVCYVDDLVDGILRLAGSDLAGPVNIGNPGEFSVLELAELVREAVGSASPIEFVPRPQDDPTVRQPDITLARTELGWEPAVSLQDGLKPTIAWIRDAVAKPEGAYGREAVDPHAGLQRGRHRRGRRQAGAGRALPVRRRAGHRRRRQLGRHRDAAGRDRRPPGIRAHPPGQPGQGRGDPDRGGRGHRNPRGHVRRRPRILARGPAGAAAPGAGGRGRGGLRDPLVLQPHRVLVLVRARQQGRHVLRQRAVRLLDQRPGDLLQADAAGGLPLARRALGGLRHGGRDHREAAQARHPAVRGADPLPGPQPRRGQEADLAGRRRGDLDPEPHPARPLRLRAGAGPGWQSARAVG